MMFEKKLFQSICYLHFIKCNSFIIYQDYIFSRFNFIRKERFDSIPKLPVTSNILFIQVCKIFFFSLFSEVINKNFFALYNLINFDQVDFLKICSLHDSFKQRLSHERYIIPAYVLSLSWCMLVKYLMIDIEKQVKVFNIIVILIIKS